MNPVIQREFYGILRSPKALAMLLILTIVFSVAVLMRWPSDASADLSGSQSLEVFRIFGYGLLAGVMFLVPAFPAVSIVNEKNDGTLELLLNSPLTAGAIYFGKISGVLLFSLLVLLSSLPASAACYAMGGIDFTAELGLLYFVLLLLVIQYSTLGMLVSSYAQTSDAAVRITYSAVFALFFLTLIPHAFMQGTGDWGMLKWVGDWIRYLSPLPAVMEIMGQSSVASAGLKETNSTLGFVIVTLVSSLLFAVKTLTRLNYRIFDKSRAQGVITDDRGLGTRVARRLFYIVDPQRRKAGIPWFLNPVMVKEFRCRRFGRMQWLLRLIAFCAVVSMILTSMTALGVTSWGVNSIGALLVVLQVMLVLVLTPSLASGLISGELDSGGWALLRMTPMSARQVVTGKILSVIWTLLLVLMATLPGYIMMIVIQPTMITQVQIVLICLGWTAAYVLAVSAAIGGMFRSTAVSTTMSYVLVIALFLLPMIVWLRREAPFGQDTVEAALKSNPVGAALGALQTPGFESYDLLPAAWWFAGFVTLFMLFILGIQVWRLTRPD
ncbi:ABC transporter permease [Rubripirellula sp.]|jgi:ABC-type transport system involved in multi-copper enzyme maturation permease subunit|nr:ABC transporter permease subunit [Planctomycetaceae bacterium]MDA9857023.1 ABC transporter permease [Rubripirellula sp.]MDF1844888.1 ABC transporter permease [Rubripirellula sp.]